PSPTYPLSLHDALPISLRVRRHQAVLDPVVDHLHEVARTALATVQVPMFRRPAPPVAPRSPHERPGSRREGGEDRIEPAHHLGLDRKSTRLNSSHQIIS